MNFNVCSFHCFFFSADNLVYILDRTANQILMYNTDQEDTVSIATLYSLMAYSLV